MKIKKFKNENFNLRFEKEYDKNEYGQEITKETFGEYGCLGQLATLICNSAEMDFILEDEPYDNIWCFYNANTMKFYFVSFQDALDFFKGKSIKLIAIKDDSYKELFGSFFKEDETASVYTLECTCSCCGKQGKYEMDGEEYATLKKYWCYGRQMGLLQDLFPKVPAWIRGGAIDQFSGGFCMCPECCGLGVDEDGYYNEEEE